MSSLVLKDCGLHFGDTPGPCSKCRYFAELYSNRKYRDGLQYNGVPWIAVLTPPGDPDVPVPAYPADQV